MPHRNLCMLRLMLEAGLRAGEVVAMRPGHLNMQTCKLMACEGEGAKDGTLWINDELRDLIGEWLERRPESKWLFLTREGTRLDTQYLRSIRYRCSWSALAGSYLLAGAWWPG
jgi:integrase